MAEIILPRLVSFWRLVLSKPVKSSGDVIKSLRVRIRAADGWPDWIN